MTFNIKFVRIYLVIKLNKKTKLLLTSVIVISLLLLIYSIVNIVIWKKDSNKTNKQIEDIQEEIKVTEVVDTENTEIIKQEEEIPEFNPYWDYIKMNMLNVDFSELTKINNNVRGWIQVNGTNINYPFVQANDNKYYLTHSLINLGIVLDGYF